ncbi:MULTISPECIES: hypothetical protein [Pseudomonas]|uniref:DUF3757 domain-containing protein n=1 Tax=Pseudomonas cedrina TaxID=651740 RepID=A0A2S9CUM4_PSECE|nr:MULTISPECIES: hypothetical protein [Pseudomonas]AVJ24107.1 hypothetical protein CLM72_21230 [Pseudomonas sp. MYb193]PRB84203.1 hypothetical protein CQ006_28030 [Pseudomonas cedrina]
MKIFKCFIIAAISSIPTFAFSQQFTYFSYEEGGYTGKMLVANELAHGSPVQPIAVHIQTVDTGTHHECDVWAMENTVARIQSNGEISTSMRVVDRNKKATGETFDITIGKSAAVITSSTPSEYCGLSGTFSGHWVRSQEEDNGDDKQEAEQDAL